MRTILFLCILAISGCVTRDPQVVQLQHEVRIIREDVAEMSKKLDRTSRTATSASVRATKNAAKVENVKRVAEKAPDAVQESKSPVIRSEEKSVIMKPREINHETSFLP